MPPLPLIFFLTTAFLADSVAATVEGVLLAPPVCFGTVSVFFYQMGQQVSRMNRFAYYTLVHFRTASHSVRVANLGCSLEGWKEPIC